MKIKEILAGEVGQRATGFMVHIKTAKKIWQVGDIWYQQVVLMDETGEMLADINLGKTTIPNTRPALNKHHAIKVISCELQESEYMDKPCKKLYIDQYTIPSMTADEYMDKQDDIIEDYTKTIRSKILCWLVAAKIETGANTLQVLEFINDSRTKQIVDKILEG